MTTTEFSIEFDILYNNIMSNAAPGLNEYEKSVLLTQAQETIVLKLYNGTLNADSFEATEEVKSYLESLVKQVTATQKTGEEIKGISEKKSKIYSKPEDLWFIVYEAAKIKSDSLGCKNENIVEVQPITHDSYHQVSSNPFKRDNDRRVLRLMYSDSLELISDYDIPSYYIRYIKKPDPIILANLKEYDVLIDGKTDVTECELHPALHRLILTTAVQMAKSLWLQTSGE